MVVSEKSFKNKPKIYWNLHLSFVHLINEKEKKFETNRPKIPLMKVSKAVENEVKWKETSDLRSQIEEQLVFLFVPFF